MYTAEASEDLLDELFLAPQVELSQVGARPLGSERFVGDHLVDLLQLWMNSETLQRTSSVLWPRGLLTIHWNVVVILSERQGRPVLWKREFPVRTFLQENFETSRNTGRAFSVLTRWAWT